MSLFHCGVKYDFTLSPIYDFNIRYSQDERLYLFNHRDVWDINSSEMHIGGSEEMHPAYVEHQKSGRILTKTP